MKVIYNGNEPISRNIIKGKEYDVICVELVKTSIDKETFKVNYRITNEEGTPALYEAGLFDVADSTIANDYIFTKYNNGNIIIKPKIMDYISFWEDFFNDDEKAIQIFKERFPNLNN